MSTPRALVDPFTGGGSVPLAMLTEGLVDRVVLAELDEDVAAVWSCVFGSDNPSLCSKIMRFKMGREEVTTELAQPLRSSLDRAFRTILKNRTFRGGILAEGASLMNTGENGKGVASRWYPETLVKRISFLYQLKDKVEFHHDDGLEIMQRHLGRSDSALFVDPPYTVGKGAGRRLYRHNELDHVRLFELLANAQAQFVVTYDESPEVIRMASQHQFRVQRIPMKNAHHECKNELFITRV